MAWVFLASTALDLGVPSLCALDQEQQPSASVFVTVAPHIDGGTPIERVPAAPVHVDDCFCCSHCVEFALMTAPAAPAVASVDDILRGDSRLTTASYPPYHPPRA